jgi:hypothetical protein
MSGKKFNIVLIIFIIAVFALNSGHVNQQGTFREVLLPAAENLLAGNGYTHQLFGGNHALYPLWGYSIILLPDAAFGSGGRIALIIQAAMCFAAVQMIYLMFGIRRRMWHIPLWLPFAAFMSVKWPDAPAAFFIIGFIYFYTRLVKSGKSRGFLITGLMLGAAANFRSEFLFLPLLLFIMALIADRENIYAHFTHTIGSAMIMLIMLVPWAIGSKAYTDDFRFTATNGGGVAYISLGQLPGNVWDITPADPAAFEYAENHGIDNPYSARGDSLLKSAFYRAIIDHPGEFAQKIGYNIYSILRGGVYTGEYAGLKIDFDRRYEINSKISQAPGISGKIKAVMELPAEESMPIIIEKLIQAIFVPLFLGLLIIFCVILFNKKFDNTIKTNAAALVFYKIIIAALLLYEYRMMNPLWPLLLGAGLWRLENRKAARK